MKKYVYPVLSDRDCGWFRLGGPGLANCMFIVAHAYVVAQINGLELLRPTWERLGLGQLFRREPDKRLYVGLFVGGGFAQALRKLFLRTFCSRAIYFVRWDLSFFRGLWGHEESIRAYFKSVICPSAVDMVPHSLSKSIAVHVRLGDFPAHYRTPISWYKSMIKQLILCTSTSNFRILIFSDGTDVELEPLIKIPGVRRAFFGNALADLIAISRCRFLVGSDSTFSTWAAFLGNIPCIFAHLNDCPPFKTIDRYAVLSEDESIPKSLMEYLK